MNTGFNIRADLSTLDFQYGQDVCGPITEKRALDDIRESLSDFNAQGPKYVYAVAMDVYKQEHKQDLIQRNLLYGAMIFEKGQVGDEPIRSQGHVHALSQSCNASTCEVYEIWEGEAYIYMQPTTSDKQETCYAIYAKKGDVVIVPPNWAHATINANPNMQMLFGAWCVRDYGFDYTGIRKQKGIAFFPKVVNETIEFVANPTYTQGTLVVKNAREYPEFGLHKGVPIYTQYEQNQELFDFVCNPKPYAALWDRFEP